MAKYFHMIIQSENDATGKTRKEYISRKQGYSPKGWKVVALCGYHEVKEV